MKTKKKADLGAMVASGTEEQKVIVEARPKKTVAFASDRHLKAVQLYEAEAEFSDVFGPPWPDVEKQRMARCGSGRQSPQSAAGRQNPANVVLNIDAPVFVPGHMKTILESGVN